MAIEPRRRCGYRKVGGMYIVGDMGRAECHRVPVGLRIKFFRGFKNINPLQEMNYCACYGSDHFKSCSICNPPHDDIHGLMFVGANNYDQKSFLSEALRLGVSKRIASIPNNFTPGKSIVYLAVKRAPIVMDNGTLYAPAIFANFMPSGIEKLIWKSQATDEVLEALEDCGITPVVIPDGDRDHA